MATLALGAALGGAGYLAGGTAIATTLGVTGLQAAAIGFSVGSQIGNYLFAPEFKQQGPRIADLAVQSSEYGSPIPRLWGANRISGQVLWSSGITEVKKRKSSGGKGGGGGGSITTYSYNASFAIGLCQGPVTGIRRLWADATLLYDVTQTGNPYERAEGVVEDSEEDLNAKREHDKGALSAHFASGEMFERITFYPGSETQLADGLLSADPRYKTTGAPAFRGMCYAAIETLQLEQFGNRIPNISAELYTPRAGVGTALTLKLLQQQPQFGQFLHIANDVVYSVVEEAHEVDLAKFTVYKHRYGDTKAKRRRRVEAEVIGHFSGTGSTNNAPPLIGNSDTSRYIFFEATVGIWLFDTLGGAFAKPQGWVLEGLESSTLAPYIDYSFRNGVFGCAYNAGSTATARVVVRGIAGDGAWDDITYQRIGMDPAPEGFAMSDDGSHGFYSVVVTIDSVAHWRIFKFDAEDNDLDPWQIAEFPSEGGSANMYATAGSIYLHDRESVHQLGEEGQLYNTFDSGQTFAQTNFFVTNNVIVTHSTGEVENWYVPSDPEITGLEVGHILEDLAAEVDKTIDVADLAGQTLTGFFRSRPSPARASFEALQQAFLFDVIEEGSDLRAVLRGGDSQFDVVDGELIAGRDYTQSRVQDFELPVRVVTIYQSINADYQRGAQQAQRITSHSAASATIELPMVLEDSQAAQIAETFLGQAWASRDRITNISLPMMHSLVQPSDVFTLTSGEEIRRIRVTKVTHTAPGMVDLSGAIEDSEVYTSDAQGGVVAVNQDLLAFSGSTDLFVLDIPLLSSLHKDSAVYIGANGGAGWRGAVVYASSDTSGFEEVGTIVDRLTYGFTSTLLGDSQTDLVDYGNTLTVVLESGELVSTSENGFLNDKNVALIGEEIVTFRYAALVGADTYELSVFSRGRLGTETETSNHTSSDRFILLDESLIEVDVPSSFQGATYYYKAVTAGQTIDAAETDQAVYNFVRGRPFAPSHLQIVEVSGADYTLQWVRRARHTGELKDGSDVPVVDAPEAYDVEHWRASAMLTSARVTAPTAVLPLLDGDEVRVMQVSPTYGPGLFTSLTVSL